MFRGIALFCCLMSCFAITENADAGIISYSWSGRIENRSSNDPLGIGGDGVFSTVDGMDFSLAVRLDDSVVGTGASPEGRQFTVSSADLIIGGVAAQILSPTVLAFTQRDDQNRNDVAFGGSFPFFLVGSPVDVTFNGETDGMFFGIRLPGGTFNQADNPPIFPSTLNKTATQAIHTNYVTFTLNGTVLEVSTSAVPEPSSFVLLAVGVVCLVGSVLWRKRKQGLASSVAPGFD